MRIWLWLLLGSAFLVGACSASPAQRVEVSLTEWAVAPSVASVSAGAVTFIAHNRSASMVHEVAVLKIEGEHRKNIVEIEDLEPGASGQAKVTLARGEYELACVIVPGEAGSTVDHYAAGMRIPFRVQ